MAAASDRVVTVFGGTGFLGRRIVRHLRLHDFCVRVASRHPDSGHALLPLDDPQVRSIKADVHDERSVADALADAYGAVNAVSLYVEQGRETFHSVHVESAQRVAAQAQRAGVKRLIHVSGIGANPRSQSLYIRKRGEGELGFGRPLLMRFWSARRSCLGRMMAFSPPSSSSLTGSQSIQCSVTARCDCSQSTRKMLGRRSQRCCNGRKPAQLCSSAVVLASLCGAAPEQALLAHCRIHLSAYKVPHGVQLIFEIPRTGSGKIIRYNLRELIKGKSAGRTA